MRTRARACALVCNTFLAEADGLYIKFGAMDSGVFHALDLRRGLGSTGGRGASWIQGVIHSTRIRAWVRQAGGEARGAATTVAASFVVVVVSPRIMKDLKPQGEGG